MRNKHNYSVTTALQLIYLEVIPRFLLVEMRSEGFNEQYGISLPGFFPMFHGEGEAPVRY